MTNLPVTNDLDAENARAVVEAIKTKANDVWELIVAAHSGRAWIALGYESWDDLCAKEFDRARLSLPREERTETVRSLRDSGLSIRAIASATGADAKTVQTDLKSGVGNSHTSPDEPAEEIEPGAQNYAPEPDAEATGADLAQVCSETTPDEPGGFPEGVIAAVDCALSGATTRGLDGKTYQRKRKQPTTPKNPRRTPITTTALNLGEDLRKVADRVEKMLADDRLAKNRDEVATQLRHHLARTIKVCGDLDQHINPKTSADSGETRAPQRHSGNNNRKESR